MSFPGLSSFFVNTAATNNAAVIKNTPGDVRSMSIMNASAATKYLRLYNKTTAPAPGTDVATMIIAIPASSSKEIDFSLGSGNAFNVGIAIAITGAAGVNDNTSTAVGDVQANILYS